MERVRCFKVSLLLQECCSCLVQLGFSLAWLSAWHGSVLDLARCLAYFGFSLGASRGLAWGLALSFFLGSRSELLVGLSKRDGNSRCMHYHNLNLAIVASLSFHSLQCSLHESSPHTYLLFFPSHFSTSSSLTRHSLSPSHGTASPLPSTLLLTVVQ